MTMSPLARSGTSWASVSSTAAAGTISHTARGAASCLTRSSSDVAPADSDPSATRPFTVSSCRAYPTT